MPDFCCTVLQPDTNMPVFFSDRSSIDWLHDKREMLGIDPHYIEDMERKADEYGIHEDIHPEGFYAAVTQNPISEAVEKQLLQFASMLCQQYEGGITKESQQIINQFAEFDHEGFVTPGEFLAVLVDIGVSASEGETDLMDQLKDLRSEDGSYDLEQLHPEELFQEALRLANVSPADMNIPEIVFPKLDAYLTRHILDVRQVGYIVRRYVDDRGSVNYMDFVDEMLGQNDPLGYTGDSMNTMSDTDNTMSEADTHGRDSRYLHTADSTTTVGQDRFGESEGDFQGAFYATESDHGEFHSSTEAGTTGTTTGPAACYDKQETEFDLGDTNGSGLYAAQDANFLINILEHYDLELQKKKEEPGPNGPSTRIFNKAVQAVLGEHELGSVKDALDSALALAEEAQKKARTDDMSDDCARLKKKLKRMLANPLQPAPAAPAPAAPAPAAPAPAARMPVSPLPPSPDAVPAPFPPLQFIPSPGSVVLEAQAQAEAKAQAQTKAAQAKAFLATNTANMEYDKLRALEIVYNKARIEAEE